MKTLKKMDSKAVSSLVGTWVLEKSENLDDFLKEIGIKLFNKLDKKLFNYS